MRQLTQMLLITIFLACAALAQEIRLPHYEDYPAGSFQGTPAPAKIIGPGARSYRTRLREGAKEGPNFAGHHTIIYWGCGTGCKAFAVADARTGKVYFPPDIGAVLTVPYQEEDSMQYRVGSRLLVIAGDIESGGKWRGEGTYYYEWRNGGLKLIRKAALKKYGP